MKKVFASIILLAIPACEKPDPFTDDITIACSVAKNTAAHVRYLNKEAHVTFNEPPFKPIQTAVVVLSDDSFSTELSLVKDDGTAWFQDLNSSFTIIPGKVFHLTVNVGDKTFSASTTFPPQPVILEPDTFDCAPQRINGIHGERVDRIDLTIHAYTGLPAERLRIFDFNSGSSLVRLNKLYTLKDSATFTFYVDTTVNWVIASVSIEALDENMSKAEFLDWNPHYWISDLDSSAIDYVDELRAGGLSARTSFEGAYGFFGSRTYDNKTLTLRLVR